MAFALGDCDENASATARYYREQYRIIAVIRIGELSLELSLSPFNVCSCSL